MSDFFPISDKARELAQDRQIDRRWETVALDYSFSIPLDQAKLANLRTKASSMGKKLNREFVIIQHETCYEVARVG